ncbi:MAG: cyclic nucleotide-binding domain-containing protein [Pseudomonadota bacterium]
MDAVWGFFTVANLVYVAGAFYVLGLVITKQVILRLLILTGTGVYIAYYALVSSSPLWSAIYVSLLIGLANVIGLTSLLVRRSRLAIPRAHSDIYDSFPDLPPGDFRALMRLAKRYKVTKDKQITQEGTPGQKLYFVIQGSTLARKGDQAFVLPPKLFLGEIAFLTNAASSASLWLEEGAEVLEWQFDELRRRCERVPRFKLALEASISVDLARKVSWSMGRDAVRVEHIPKPMVDALSVAD